MRVKRPLKVKKIIYHSQKLKVITEFHRFKCTYETYWINQHCYRYW